MNIGKTRKICSILAASLLLGGYAGQQTDGLKQAQVAGQQRQQLTAQEDSRDGRMQEEMTQEEALQGESLPTRCGTNQQELQTDGSTQEGVQQETSVEAPKCQDAAGELCPSDTAKKSDGSCLEETVEQSDAAQQADAAELVNQTGRSNAAECPNQTGRSNAAELVNQTERSNAVQQPNVTDKSKAGCQTAQSQPVKNQPEQSCQDAEKTQPQNDGENAAEPSAECPKQDVPQENACDRETPGRNSCQYSGGQQIIIAGTSCPNGIEDLIREATERMAKRQGRQEVQEVPGQRDEAVQQPSGTQDEVQKVVDLVNEQRRAHGLGALSANGTLNQMAEARAKELVRSFSHTRPNGTSCFTIFDEYGVSYVAVGENIAYGYDTADSVMNGWMNSAGHRANILSSQFAQIGVGRYVYNGTIYWVQIFMR